MSNINNATNKFFSNINNTKDTNDTKNTTDTKKPATAKESFYNISIRFAKDLEQPMKDEAWRNRTNITQYLNELVRADLTAKGYFSKSGE